MALTNGLQLPYGIQPVNPVPVDSWSGPYYAPTELSGLTDANAAIPSAARFPSMEVRLIIDGKSSKYWYYSGITDSDLILFSGNSEISGSSGTSGISGISGVDGTSGTSGTDGSNGVDGAPGLDGYNGMDGSSGTSGTSGMDGQNGLDGSDGRDGSNGVDGGPGPEGSNGTDGSSGTSGTDGSSGTSASLDSTIVSINTSTTIDATYKGKVIEADGTLTIILPNSMDTGMRFDIVNVGTGIISISADTTLQSKNGKTTLASQYGGCSVYHRGSDIWLMVGDLL